MNLADFSPLDAAGLNLHAVLALAELPAGMRQRIDPEQAYTQLLLIGNGGPALWAAIEAEGISSADPIDDYSVRCVERWLAQNAAGNRRLIVYPDAGALAVAVAVDLQALGTLAGWHHASPLMLGINARWGTWFAYRVAVLADTDFAPTRAEVYASPCPQCAGRPCAAACPGGAVGERGGGYDVQRCLDYRLAEGSACAATCVARLACPVAGDERYSAAQLRHSYSISLRMIARHYRPTAG